MIAFGKWERVVICRRESLLDRWERIEENISKIFGSKAILRPFLDSKGAIVCPYIKLSEKMSKMGLCLIGDEIEVELSEWEPFSNIHENAIQFQKGWIVVSGLPFFLWTKKVFKEIRESYSGLLAIDTLTDYGEYLREARIMVPRFSNGFISNAVDIKVER